MAFTGHRIFLVHFAYIHGILLRASAAQACWIHLPQNPMQAMRGFQLLVLVALLIGELHCARTASAPPADAPATSPQSPEPPPADQQTPPQAPGPSPPSPRQRGSPHRRPTAPPTQDPAPPKQELEPEPAPPRLVVPPEDSPAPATPGMINHTTGCTTLLVLGDSTVDPGNNNHLPTTARANFLPYGLNFYGRRPTGRFTNGRLATDMLGKKNAYSLHLLLPMIRTISLIHNMD